MRAKDKKLSHDRHTMPHLGLFILCFFPQRRKTRSALPFINRETLSLSTLFPYLERFARKKNKKPQVLGK
jgi:hypothetical protein